MKSEPTTDGANASLLWRLWNRAKRSVVTGTTGSAARTPPHPPSRAREIQAARKELKDGTAEKLARIESLLSSDAVTEAAHVAEWFRRRLPILDGYFWLDDPEAAKAAHFAYADDLERACRNYDPGLIELALRHGYLGWPYRMRRYLRGRDILDIGCGPGLYGTAFLMMGAQSYTGVDPRINLDKARIKDKRKRRYVELPNTLGHIAEHCPDIELIPAKHDALDPDRRFDILSLHNVTEHLLDIGTILSGLGRYVRADGYLLYNHHNFYCWNGHHLAPNSVDRIDPQSEQQRQLIDWNHILNVGNFAPDHYMRTKLNRIKLDELKRMTRIAFDIEHWDEKRSPPETLERLKPDILEKVLAFDGELTRDDLEINTVTCVARPKKPAGHERQTSAAR
ncbi:class I SAM-dependent methyltransferase [Parasphingopyxis algicola]|uniref:class I SAM-dependent methyltransferase n=1 Tax=Parasphingopyxis algicola TaxID=2026624 RepID=UPI0015A06845|nr:class I SAM-dependent methyltransferase [Parasphingopyxis algicola]QLC23984.1 class I SAM-dependent methyltransferase [Parasphingopyxis algicola]